MKHFRGSLTKGYVVVGFVDDVSHPQLYHTNMEIQSEQQEGFPRLSGLRDDAAKGRSMAALLKRIRFSSREDKRARLLRGINKCNERLEHLLNLSSQTGPAIKEKNSQRKRPPMSLQRVAYTLYDVMSCCWKCNCPIRHQAMLCLKCNHSGDSSDSSDIHFDMLFSTKKNDTDSPGEWQEGQISVSLDA